VHRCAVRVSRDGLVLSRLPPDGAGPESDPLLIGWRTLHGFSADATDLAPGGLRLQALEIFCDAGVLTVLMAAPEVVVLFAAVGRWASQWRLARSPLGLVLTSRRRKVARSVA
jgi:hypothetical protein